MNLKKLFAALGVLLIVLSACTTKSVSVKTENLDSAKLAQGAVLYEESCKKCHDLPIPTEHTAEQWMKIMDWMAPKAKLTPEQKQLVYNYVTSVKK